MYTRLLKLFLHENFSLKRVLGFDMKKNKKKTVLIIILLIYAGVSFFGSFGFIFFDLGKILNEASMIDLLLMYVFVYATMITMIFSLLRSNGYLFHYKDYQILEPLPIPSRVVLFAKLTVMMIMIYFTVFIFTLPIAFSYFFHSGVTILGILFYLIGLILIPLIPTIILSFISLFISRITSKLRNSKVLVTVFLLIAMIGVMYLSFSFNMNAANPLMSQEGFISGLGEVYLPMMWFAKAVSSHDIFSLLLLFLISFVPFVLFFLGIEKMVVKTNQKGMTVVTRKNAKKAVSVTQSVTKSIIKKEWKKFISVPIYAMNSGLGAVFLFLLGVLGLIFKSDVQAFLVNMGSVNLPIEMLIIVAIGFCLSTIYTSGISLSLEGKNFWIIKSLPIKSSKIIFSKMIFNVILGLPLALFALLMLGISFQISIISLASLVLFVTSYSLVTSSFDSIINLYFPKFEYKNDTEVVKQSLGSVISIFGNWGFIIVNGILTFLLWDIIGWEWMIILNSILNIGLFVVFVSVIKKVSAPLILKMTA
jgi:ABC-2 type transport system permease protein